MVKKEADQIRRMFARIAPRYDLLNRLLSAGTDQRWRRRTRFELAPLLPPEALILDLCTGTGDLALVLSRLGRVVGCDFCHPMLTLGLKKSTQKGLNPGVRFVEGDALRLPLARGTFDAVAIAFGLRNLEDLSGGLLEIRRALKSGGILAILEFSVPRFPIFRQVYLFYFTKVLPLVGRLVSQKSGPYSYLPRSVRGFPTPDQLAQILDDSGFRTIKVISLTAGIATLYLARSTSKGRGVEGTIV